MGKSKTKQQSLQVEINKMEELIKANSTNLNKECNVFFTKQLEAIKKYSEDKKPVRKAGVNSGLQKPVMISEEMCKFCKWPLDEKHSRVDVTKAICDYIKEKDLQNPENRREIMVDKTLKRLLKYKDDKITYPHIQKHINSHFIKPEPVKVEPVKVEPVAS